MYILPQCNLLTKVLTTYANKLMDFMEYIADLRQRKHMKYNISFAKVRKLISI